MAVFKLPFGQKILTKFDKNLLVFLSPIKIERENTGRLKLKGGESYVIVCSPEMQGTLGSVYLSLYTDQWMRDCEIKRVFHPLDKNEANEAVLPTFIPEESEKASARVPTWKLLLC